MSEPAINREIEVDAGPEEVWRALTDEALLERWLATEVELEPREGGRVSARDEDGRGRSGVIERFEEPHELVFRWYDDDGVESRVALRVVEIDAGSRLIVTETATAGPVAAALASVAWGFRLALLARAICRAAATVA